ncbi:MAG: Rrf2 family transcriptional regulator [Acidobacteria bacterium]|nr:Rrf2 family transcriptional regulator [Acidobacteriota bacterium]
MLFDHSSELAIRATLFLAQQPVGRLSPVRQIAARIGVSEAYLAKIFQRLGAAGLVKSHRGPGKGMELGAAPETITLGQIVRAVHTSIDSHDCVLGLSMCSGENPCVLHEDWLPHRTAIRQLLEKRTLADLLRSVPQRSAEDKLTSGRTPASGLRDAGRSA